jgi:UDPglucose--hexose-1-phosphate uridylyltransferase
MSELRWNPFLGEWLITATHRQDRTFLPPADFCPLCPSRPGGPQTEIDRPDFEIVVFENRFPALRPRPETPSVTGSDLSPVRPSYGVCEVVIYTPDHDASLADAGRAQIERLIAVWAHRTLELGALDGIEYVFAFENKGQEIGVTLSHPHGQIYAYPFLPPLIGREVAAADAHVAEHGSCLWCANLDQELADGRRIVVENDSWVAGVPFAARWPYELHLTPRRHSGWLHELDAAERSDLAAMLEGVLRGYDRLFGFSLPYVMAIHQRPTDGPQRTSFHQHVEFYPPNRTATKLKYLAGSEAGAGTFINDTLPEETAPRLREAIGSVRP